MILLVRPKCNWFTKTNKHRSRTHVCDVIRAFASLVLLEQFLGRSSSVWTSETRTKKIHHTTASPRIVKFFQRVFKNLFLFVLLQERVALSETVKLV